MSENENKNLPEGENSQNDAEFLKSRAVVEGSVEKGVTSSEGFQEKLIDVDINREMRKSFLDYSMSVIVSRALPDVRDGLKPVHRRILYTMFERNLTPNNAYHKCAATVGAVLGDYHPHGDASVYDAMVRLAQGFSMRYPLVDGHGNFGSVDGDPPAAYRYTEARMSRMSMMMWSYIDKDTVDFMPNYDNNKKEPTVLPSRFPNLLVNGSTGIAVGMATNIPPHNLNEVVDGMCLLIDNPDVELAQLMEVIKGPDFPTAGIIMGRAGIRAAYATGRGKIIVRARAEIVERKNGYFSIVVDQLPYQVNKARLVESIADLVKDKRIEGISAINDYSGRAGMRMQIDLKREANPQVVLNNLYSLTQMQITFGVIMLALVNGEPKILTLKEILQNYIKYQEEVIVRRVKFNLKKAQERAHILEGLKIALDFIDEVIAILRSSKSIGEGKERLMERFGLDDVQADAIVKMQLGRLTGLEREKIEAELAELAAKIKEYFEILGDERKVLEIVKNEAIEIKNKYGDERRTRIENVSGEVDIEDLIPEENCVFTMTTMGYLKRQPVDAYRTQKRGGRGISGMARREEDVAETMFIGSTHEYVLFFTNRGRVFRLKGYEIPESGRTSKGMNVVNLLPIEEGEKVEAMIRVPKLDEGEEDTRNICMVTRRGIIKRSALSLYQNIRKVGLRAINIDEGDELAWVRLTSGSDDLMVATRKGMSIRFNEADAREVGRVARGVKAVTLRDGDEVIGMAVLAGEGEVLTVSETGNGRRSPFSEYRLQSRGGKGLINYHVEKYGDVAAVIVVEDTDDIIMIASDGVIIRIAAAGINTLSRTSKGVRVMKVNPGEKLVTVARAEHDEEEVQEIEQQDAEEEPSEQAETEENTSAESD